VGFPGQGPPHRAASSDNVPVSSSVNVEEGVTSGRVPHGVVVGEASPGTWLGGPVISGCPASVGVAGIGDAPTDSSVCAETPQAAIAVSAATMSRVYMLRLGAF